MFTLGSDPEFFLEYKDKPISAHDMVPGTKKKPEKLARGVAVQADGTAVEINIKPAKTGKQFQENTLDALEQVRGIVPKKFKFSMTPAVFFEPKYFSTLPDVAKELGCEPDFDANSQGAINPTPKPAGKYETMRTAAGHIHYGFTKDADIFSQSHRWDCVQLALRSDSTFRPFMKNWDKDKDRIKLYGKNACFRPKPYGVEYRALSVAWLKYPDLYPWIFDTAKFIHDGMVNGQSLYYGCPAFNTSMLEKELSI